MILQWGHYVGSVTNGTAVTITFPISFGTIYSVSGSIDTPGGSGVPYGLAATSVSAASVIFKTYGYQSGGGGTGAGFYWFAVGI